MATTRTGMSVAPAPVAKATSTTDVTINASTRRKLLTEFKAYAALHAELAPIKHAMEKIKGRIQELRESTGSSSVEIDGFKTVEVASTYKKFNPDKFVALGGSLTMYNEAMEDRPKRPYEKVTCPGEKDED